MIQLLAVDRNMLLNVRFQYISTQRTLGELLILGDRIEGRFWAQDGQTKVLKEDDQTSSVAKTMPFN